MNKTPYIFRSYIIFMLPLVMIYSSCKKYLDKKQNAKLIVPSSLYDMQALLDNAVMNQSRTPSYGEASSDEYFFSQAAYNSLTEGDQDYYTWQNYFFGTGNDWSACYQAVYNSNLVLDLIKNINRNINNKDQYDNVKGSALFFRSYYFLWLLWNYAKAYDSTTAGHDPGIALRQTSDFNVPSVRATNEQSYQQVITDTKASVPLLPSYPLNVMRPSKGAAYGLLARCYLSMRDYRQALLYADSALQLNHRLMNYNSDDDIPSGLGVNMPFSKFNKEIIFYSDMDNFYTLYRSSKSRVDSTLFMLYDATDLRKAAFYKKNADGYYQFKGTYGIFSTSYFSGIATDEMYLISAECCIRGNEIEKGLDDLNTLLQNRYKADAYNPVATDVQKDALDKVLTERRKELMMRGQRWMDLKRLNKEGNGIILERLVNNTIVSLSPNANFYALPIPADIIQMTGMPQNDL